MDELCANATTAQAMVIYSATTIGPLVSYAQLQAMVRNTATGNGHLFSYRQWSYTLQLAMVIYLATCNYRLFNYRLRHLTRVYVHWKNTIQNPLNLRGLICYTITIWTCLFQFASFGNTLTYIGATLFTTTTTSEARLVYCVTLTWVDYFRPI